MPNAKKLVKDFLRACIDSKNFETNPLLQDYITPETVTVIEEVLGKLYEVPNGGDWEDYREIPGSFFAWYILGKWHVFSVQGEAPGIKGGIRVVKSASFEDHFEELWQSKLDGTWYRRVGCGRGIYWTQSLELIDVVSKIVTKEQVLDFINAKAVSCNEVVMHFGSKSYLIHPLLLALVNEQKLDIKQGRGKYGIYYYMRRK